MSSYVVDASVAAKWLFPEIHAEAASRLRTAAHRLVAPDLLWAELGNVIWKKIQRRELTQAEGRDALKIFRAVPLRAYGTGDLLELAFEIAVATSRTVYDSLYVAVAVATDAPLVTADRKFYDACRRSPHGGRLVWVEDVDASRDG